MHSYPIKFMEVFLNSCMIGFNFGQNIIDQINSDGFLDVIIEDDTQVDYFELEINLYYIKINYILIKEIYFKSV